MALHPDLEDERYHANEGEYANDIHEAGVVWVVLKISPYSRHTYLCKVFQSLGAARRYIQTWNMDIEYERNEETSHGNSEWWLSSSKRHHWDFVIHLMDVQS